MSETYYSAKELAQHLEMPDSSFRSMTDRLDREGIIQRTKKGTSWKYSEEAKSVLEIVRNLRAEDKGYDTIVRRLAPDERKYDTNIHEQASAQRKTNVNQSQDERELNARPTHIIARSAPDERELSARIINEMEEMVSRQLTNNNELAEKYARASFEIGQLQERVANLEDKLQQSEAERKLIASQLDAEREPIVRPAQDQRPITAWEAFVSFITGRPWEKQF